MSNLTRRDSYNTPSLFRKSINDLFDNFFGTGVLSPLSDFTASDFPTFTTGIALDVIDRGNDYLVKANLPGMDKSDVEIQLTDNNVLTIKGAYKQQAENKDGHYLLQERRSGSFSRSISFNEDLVPTKINAFFTNGILEITLPKAEVQNPKTVRIPIEN
ncbi:MAG TPA: Hsp20/alpha crystallin family protein [Patescibacteria group bacterium]|nr:Hsp20/alpha crystallin family protein [Patescibacteria group bacterium]